MNPFDQGATYVNPKKGGRGEGAVDLNCTFMAMPGRNFCQVQ